MEQKTEFILNLPIADINFSICFEKQTSCSYFKKRFQTIQNNTKKTTSDLYIYESLTEYTLKLPSRRVILNMPKTGLENLYFTIQTLIQYSVINSNIIFIHASCLINNNKALLFMAPSGSGKSTVIKNFPRSQIISDDITILKKDKNKFYVYTSTLDNKYFQGFPLKKLPLDKIFFIKKASFTSINEIGTFEEKLNVILHNNLLFWFMQIQQKDKVILSNSIKSKLYNLALDLTIEGSPQILYLKKDRSFINLI